MSKESTQINIETMSDEEFLALDLKSLSKEGRIRMYARAHQIGCSDTTQACKTIIEQFMFHWFMHGKNWSGKYKPWQDKFEAFAKDHEVEPQDLAEAVGNFTSFIYSNWVYPDVGVNWSKLPKFTGKRDKVYTAAEEFVNYLKDDIFNSGTSFNALFLMARAVLRAPNATYFYPDFVNEFSGCLFSLFESDIPKLLERWPATAKEGKDNE